MHLLALNGGSSSLKFGLYRADAGGVQCLLAGQADGSGSAAAVQHIGRQLAASGLPQPQAIGHRIVHGGPALRQHSRIDATVLAQLQAAMPFAPLHMPAALAIIQAAALLYPGLPQVACLDSCFHHSMPPVASTLPLPAALRAAGLQRYGFHGLSCASIVEQLGAALPARLLIAHLGNGASITAVQHGLSIDTSMGLTPCGGLVMGTRSGDLDPGLLVHLMRSQQLDAAGMERLVDQQCGLLGISGLASDMRRLHQAADSHADARLAIAMFCYAVAKTLGAMAVALDGVDQIVFTGGIGEHDALVRAAVCTRLACLGVALDPARNQLGQGRVSSAASHCLVQVLPSDEDGQIARHTWALCQPVA